MPMTETQVRVLAALVGRGSLTVRELCEATRLSGSTVRAVLDQHSYSGLAQGSGERPAVWEITAKGRAVMNSPAYFEYLPRGGAAANGNG